ncbi:Peptidase, partial [Oryctes borbonicus]
MEVYATLLIIAGIYSLLFFLDRFYKTCSHYPYIQFLKGTGLEVRFLHIKWQTTALNRTFLRWGSGHSSFFSAWFQWGTYISVLLLPIAIILLIVTIFQTFSRKTTNNSVMEAVIPGVNLPASELGYYSLTLIISSIVHEAGHGIAAIREDVHLSNVGINLFFILPVAYVSLNSDDIQKLNPRKSLKIFCAGVWHNIMLSVVAYAVYMILPILFSSLYILNNGVIVTDIAKHSPLKGANGLYSNDKVIQIN